MWPSRGLGNGHARQLYRTITADYHSDIMDPSIVPPSLSEVAPFIRVAIDIEDKSPRVAYLCLRHALNKAIEIDPNSCGRRVMQFKTALRHKLEQKGAAIYASDAKEVHGFYQNLRNHAKSLESTIGRSMDRAQLYKTIKSAAVLLEVFEAISRNDSSEISPELRILESGEELAAKQEIYVAYNILPLDPAGLSQAVMMLPKIKAAVLVLQEIRRLPWPPDTQETKQKSVGLDLLDWLQIMFGFQEGNVMNQREHLILLLASADFGQSPSQSSQKKLDDLPLHEVKEKLLKNYRKWCKFLGCECNLRIPTMSLEAQRQILYIGLYLLIWGEAANLRFMPECLCYIFHHMALEVNFLLDNVVSSNTCENIRLTYGGEEYSFLTKVITPMYKVIYKEVTKSKTASHSTWRNYDDLNEYFWSSDCFSLGWPWRADADFFKTSKRKVSLVHLEGRRTISWNGKTRYIEIRSFWHIFRSFNRMWSFFILALQTLILVAWNGSGPISDMFNGSVFKKVSSIFITAAVLDLFQALVEIALSVEAWRSMRFTDILRYGLKVVAALVWVIILPIGYTRTWENPTGLVGTLKNWLGHSSRSPFMYITAVVMYLVPHAIGASIFLFPKLRQVMERSHSVLIRLILWWPQPCLFVGRGMHDTQYTLFKYTLFWLVLLVSKFMFSYYFEIRPLVELTRQIINAPMAGQYKWHEFFPNAKGNWGVLLALWIPVLMVYFMDTQIWYAVWSAIFGGINGAFSRLGEIRSLAMLRSRFCSLPGAFYANLVHSAAEQPRSRPFSFRCSFAKVVPGKSPAFTKFSQLWNEVINSFREEDLIDNIQRDLLLVPCSSEPTMNLTAWPSFLLASKVPKAINLMEHVTDSWNDDDLMKILSADEYMNYAMEECYGLFIFFLQSIVIGEKEIRIIEEIMKEVETNIMNKTLLKLLRMEAMPLLYEKFLKLVEILDKCDPEQMHNLAELLQDMFEVYTLDMKRDGSFCDDLLDEEIVDTSNQCSSGSHKGFQNRHSQLFDQNSLCYPLPIPDSWKKKIKRLQLLLLTEESLVDVPTNVNARRRLTFFTNSLFMDMPSAPKVQNMMSFSVLTPYHDEETLLTQRVLEEENEDGISILDYLQHIYPDEWSNFQERLKGSEPTVLASESCKWASYRLPTLARTVRGMMYYGKALELHAFLDMASEKEIQQGYKKTLHSAPGNVNSQQSLYMDIQALADIKFTYVVSCQNYALYRHTEDYRRKQVLELLKEYPSLRMAYIDEVGVNDDKEYYSVLVKGFSGSNFHQEVYRIKLPGNPFMGEGKSENQNHAIIFTRGQALQVIDMNEDNYLEEALKMRNFLQEFQQDSGVGFPSILGMREHCFTESNSSLAQFISSQESSFVTIGQRILVNPLRVRFHYGHSDVFDRLFHITRGGISKASRVINLNESIYAGFNTTLRGGNIMHQQYIQVGKGQNVRFNQISCFHAKNAVGNGEQMMSRDIYRLGHHLDFFRMLSVYFTTVGYYVSNLILVLTVYAFLYGRLYLALSGVEKGLFELVGLQKSRPLQAALASESFVISGLLMAVPVVTEIGLEQGFRRAFSRFIIMQLKLSSLFLTFCIGTKAYFFGRTLLHGGDNYKQPASRHEFFLCHEKFAQNYRLYSRSHFTKAIELLMLLIVYHVYGASENKTAASYLINFSLWFLVGAWLFAPFLFNPQGFEWQKTVDDWHDWIKWIKSSGKIGVPGIKSWESWWEEEQFHLNFVSVQAQLIEVFLSARFFLYQYGVVYHLRIVHRSKSILVYVLSWLVIVVMLAVLKVIAMSRKRLKKEDRLVVRFLKVGLFTAATLTMIALFVVGCLTIVDVFASALAFIPSGWALLQISQACKGLTQKAGMWESVKGLARCYDYLMGLMVFAPIAALSWIPIISDFQICILFDRPFLSFLVSRQENRRKRVWIQERK